MLPAATSAVVRAARGLGLANLVGAVLNLPKFGLLLALLAPADLDVLAVGLLITLTFGQIAGEALANHAAVAPSRGRRPDGADIVGIALIALIAAGALVPERVMAITAPGLAADAHLDAVRLFCLAGAAMIALWWAAGEAQARLDLRGLAAVSSVPNLAVVTALLVPVGPPVPRVAAALAGAIALAAVLVVIATRRNSATPATSVLAAGRTGLRHLAALLILALASQLNLVALRVFGSELPAGSLSAVYLATGAALLPACAVSGTVAGVLVPRWARTTGTPRIAGECSAAAVAAAACAALIVPPLALLIIDGERMLAAVGVDPSMAAPLLAALPILLLAAPGASAAWVLRGAMVARGRTVIVSTFGVAGAALIPATVAISPTIEGLALGYALSVIPWIFGIPLLLSAARRTTGVATVQIAWSAVK